MPVEVADPQRGDRGQVPHRGPGDLAQAGRHQVGAGHLAEITGGHPAVDHADQQPEPGLRAFLVAVRDADVQQAPEALEDLDLPAEVPSRLIQQPENRFERLDYGGAHWMTSR